VAEAAVIGVYDELKGQVPVVFATLKSAVTQDDEVARRTAAAGLRVDAAAREVALNELVEQCGEVLDQHVDALLSAVAVDAEGRRLLHRSARRSVQATAGEDEEPADERAGALPGG